MNSIKNEKCFNLEKCSHQEPPLVQDKCNFKRTQDQNQDMFTQARWKDGN